MSDTVATGPTGGIFTGQDVADITRGGSGQDFTITQKVVKTAPIKESRVKDDRYIPESRTKDDLYTDPHLPENPEIPGTKLWMRKWKLSIGTESGSDALNLSDFAFEFTVDTAVAMVPFLAVIRIYNVAKDDIAKMQKEYTQVYLEAGYRGGPDDKIFAGPIAYYKHGRLNGTDTFVEIHAITHDQALSQTLINDYLAAGYRKIDVVSAALGAWAPWNIKMGQITDLGDEKSPRGRALFGMVPDIIRDVAATADAVAFIDNEGNLHMLKKDEALRMETMTIPILNVHTGLIDVPTQTLGAGVDAKCLLNPQIRPGGVVRLNNKDLVQYETADPNAAGQLVDTNQQLIFTKGAFAADGYYTVVSLRHTGQSRGNSWYTDIKTAPLDPTKYPLGLRTSG